MFSFYNKIVQEDMQELVSREIDFERLNYKTVLITGANGMLATYLVYVLMYLNINKSYNIKVLALVRNKERAQRRFGDFFDNPLFTLMEQDVCDSVSYQQDIHFIIHAAGNASPKYILTDPVGIIKANIIGTINILELAKNRNTERILYTSTREVYGKVAENIHEITEYDNGILDFNDLRACYPESKRLAETLLKSYSYQYGVPYITARIAHSYGPGMQIEQDGRVMADFISDVVNKRNIVLKSTGEAKRAFCYITDAVSGILIALLEGTPGQAYNIANENEDIRICDVARLMTDIFPDRGLKVLYDIPEKQSAGYSKMGRTKLSTKKIEELGWKCEISLQAGIERTIASFS